MAGKDWTVPEIDHPDVDMYKLQRRAVLYDERPLPYSGLPRDWIDHALAVVLEFDPDKVFHFRLDPPERGRRALGHRLARGVRGDAA